MPKTIAQPQLQRIWVLIDNEGMPGGIVAYEKSSAEQYLKTLHSDGRMGWYFQCYVVSKEQLIPGYVIEPNN